MEGGYVLNFSDKSMSNFFIDDLNIDIDDACWKQGGTSKAKRLRYLLQSVDKRTAIRVLNALWEYRQAMYALSNCNDPVPNASGLFFELMNRLEGRSPSGIISGTGHPPSPAIDHSWYERLKTELLTLVRLEPQPRGYAFEAFLKQLFDIHGLQARGSFRIAGEQIDGSFQLEGETYLVEAKWQNSCVSADALHVFQGKVEQKAVWARGVFISHSGFTVEGLDAFGRNKRIVCLDGRDIYEALERRIPIGDVIKRKVRLAAETGQVFVSVREIF
jgi:hypothetical protein